MAYQMEDSPCFYRRTGFGAVRCCVLAPRRGPTSGQVLNTSLWKKRLTREKAKKETDCSTQILALIALRWWLLGNGRELG